MVSYHIPDDLTPPAGWQAAGVGLFAYRSMPELEARTKVTLTAHVISLLHEGEKTVFFPEQQAMGTAGQALLMAAGNCLMSERAAVGGEFRSTMLFFTPARVSELQRRHPQLLPLLWAGAAPGPCFTFAQDEYVLNLRASLAPCAAAAPAFRPALLALKLEELALYLAAAYPATFPAFFATLAYPPATVAFRSVVESAGNQQATVEELAFLCHMSVSTFQRTFERHYGCPPARWRQLQRLQQAAFRLRHEQARASEVYAESGYESLSSFIQAFRKAFGMTPKAYQQRG